VKMILLVAYVDDIVITGGDTKGIDSLKYFSDQGSHISEVLLRR